MSNDKNRRGPTRWVFGLDGLDSILDQPIFHKVDNIYDKLRPYGWFSLEDEDPILPPDNSVIEMTDGVNGCFVINYFGPGNFHLCTPIILRPCPLIPIPEDGQVRPNYSDVIAWRFYTGSSDYDDLPGLGLSHLGAGWIPFSFRKPVNGAIIDATDGASIMRGMFHQSLGKYAVSRIYDPHSRSFNKTMGSMVETQGQEYFRVDDVHAWRYPISVHQRTRETPDPIKMCKASLKAETFDKYIDSLGYIKEDLSSL